MQLAYLVLLVIVLIHDYQQYRNVSRALNFCLLALCAFLIVAIPLMAEYFVVQDLIERVSEKTNADNFLVPSWGQIINLFNPFFHTYIHWFGGYLYIPIAMGYVGMITLLPIFFYRHTPDKSVEFKILITAVVVSLLLVFSSSQLGPTRWPFRYLPVAIFLIATLSVYLIDKAKLCFSATRLRYYLWSVGFFALIQLFSAEGTVFKSQHVLSVLYFILLCWLLIYPFYQQQQRKAYPYAILCLVSFLAWFGGILQTKTLAETRLTYPRVTTTVSGVFPKNAYLLSLAPIGGNKNKDVSDLFSAQYLLYGAKSINGYSPVGHQGIQSRFPSQSSHGYFKPQESLINLSQPAEGLSGVFDYQLMNIAAICAYKSDITPVIASLFKQANLEVSVYPKKNKMLILPATPNQSEGSLTYQTVAHSISLDYHDGMLHEWFDVKPTNIERTLIFSRVYWPGYHAILDGIEYPVLAYKNFLLKVLLPEDVSGKLHLYYEPVSWQYTKWSMVLGVVLLILLAKYQRFTG